MSALLRRTLPAVVALGVTTGLVLAAPTAATAAPAPTAATAAPAPRVATAASAQNATAGPAQLKAVAAPGSATTQISPALRSTVAAPDGVSVAAVPCSSISQIGDKKVVTDLGMQAFTVRQYIGWCSDSRGSAWMNFASVYVWDQYHNRGFAYRVSSGIVVRGEPEARGFATSANRQQTSYSLPVRTTQLCTQGWGKIFRSGSESPQGLTPLVC